MAKLINRIASNIDMYADLFWSGGASIARNNIGLSMSEGYQYWGGQAVGMVKLADNPFYVNPESTTKNASLASFSDTMILDIVGPNQPPSDYFKFTYPRTTDEPTLLSNSTLYPEYSKQITAMFINNNKRVGNGCDTVVFGDDIWFSNGLKPNATRKYSRNNHFYNEQYVYSNAFGRLLTACPMRNGSERITIGDNQHVGQLGLCAPTVSHAAVPDGSYDSSFDVVYLTAFRRCIIQPSYYGVGNQTSYITYNRDVNIRLPYSGTLALTEGPMWHESDCGGGYPRTDDTYWGHYVGDYDGYYIGDVNDCIWNKPNNTPLIHMSRRNQASCCVCTSSRSETKRIYLDNSLYITVTSVSNGVEVNDNIFTVRIFNTYHDSSRGDGKWTCRYTAKCSYLYDVDTGVAIAPSIYNIKETYQDFTQVKTNTVGIADDIYCESADNTYIHTDFSDSFRRITFPIGHKIDYKTLVPYVSCRLYITMSSSPESSSDPINQLGANLISYTYDRLCGKSYTTGAKTMSIVLDISGGEYVMNKGMIATAGEKWIYSAMAKFGGWR